MKCFDVLAGDLLPEILDHALKVERVDTLLVTIRSSTDMQGKRSLPRSLDGRVKSIFGENVIDVIDADAWPGTKLIGHVGRVYFVRFDASTAEIVLKTSSDLFAWRQNSAPSLPEDFCLIKKGAEFPFLISVTHERDAWLVTERPPRLNGVRESRFVPQELVFAPGPSFCGMA